MKVLDIVKDNIVEEDLEIMKKYEPEPLIGWEQFEQAIRKRNESLNTIEDFIEYSPIFNKYKYKDAVTRVNTAIEKINIQHYYLL